MPVSIEYDWKQTESDLVISIPFKVKSLQNANVDVSDLVLKVSQAPFFLLLDLANKVVPSSLQKRVEAGNILHLHLTKASKGHWQALTFDGSKDESNVRRTASTQRREEEIKHLHKLTVAKRVEEERATLRDQMKLDKKEMQQIDDIKNKEKRLAEDAVYDSMIALDSTRNHEGADNVGLALPDKTGNTTDAVPSVRLPSVVTFKHTPRFFKTPMRESTKVQEQAFIVKNRPYLKANKYFNSEQSSISEVDPTWLKRKGDEFFNRGDYLAAINAYSTIIEKDESFLKAFMNRSTCYLIIEEAELCLHDCVEALKILGGKAHVLDIIISTPMRAKIYIRMATAYCQLGGQNNLKLSLAKLQNASTVDPNNAVINADIARIEQSIGAHEQKRNADTAFGHGLVEESIGLYNQAIAIDDTLLQAYSNRSAAFFVSTQYANCIKDCSFVLDALKKATHSMGIFSHSTSIGCIPRPGSDLRENMVKTCLSRRAIAYDKFNKPSLSSNDWTLLSKLIGEGEQEIESAV